MSILRHARVPLPVDREALRTDVAALPDAWRPHFQTAHHEGGWTVLPLRAPSGAVDEAIPFPLAGGPAQYRPTPWLAQCHGIARFLAGLACPVLAARLLRLAPGAAIRPHRDAELAYEKGEARLHVLIVSNPGVEFVIATLDPQCEEACFELNRRFVIGPYAPVRTPSVLRDVRARLGLDAHRLRDPDVRPRDADEGRGADAEAGVRSTTDHGSAYFDSSHEAPRMPRHFDHWFRGASGEVADRASSSNFSTRIVR